MHLPLLETVEHVSAYTATARDMPARDRSATSAFAIRYPVLGPPLPNQPKVCKVLVDGRVCGVGGHSAKTHAKSLSLSTRALTHATWILEHLECLAQQEALKQCRALVWLLQDLEAQRQHQREKGFADQSSELRAVLVMYITVKKHYDAVFGDKRVGTIVPKSETRNFRSTVYLLNALLPTLPSRAIPPETFVLPEDKKLVVYLFPDTPHLKQLCVDAFREAPDVWKTNMERTIHGHRAMCLSDEWCGCAPLDVLKADASIQGYATCAVCGMLGHQKRSCAGINAVTHVAIALATLMDSEKNRRIDARCAHLSLYNAYHMIVALLYRWVVYDTHDWEIRGKQRLARVGKDNPWVILQLFNYVVSTLKTNHPLIGPTLGVVHDPSHLYLEAAHDYHAPVVKKMRPDVKALRREVKAQTQDFQDQDLYRACATLPMAPQRHKDVSTMIHSSAIWDRRMMLDADTRALGLRFGLGFC